MYKFGGASIKDADSINNVANLLKNTEYDKMFLIISAIGSTTNMLENIVNNILHKKYIHNYIDAIIKTHINICNDLFDKNHKIFQTIINHYNYIIKNNYIINNNYNFIYDQIVSYGEIISTKIISEYFKCINIKNKWLDVRKYIKTDNSYTNAKVNWPKTQLLIKSLHENNLYITQGFLGSNSKGSTTTLGREGSDYSASIFSLCSHANEQIIWKDVPGVLNADPKHFKNTKLLRNISYQEALKLSYYGASIIHPKTIKPLIIKNIPLYVKSFIHPNKSGTVIKNHVDKKQTCFTVKQNQVVLILIYKKHDVIYEKYIFHIFKELISNNIKCNLLYTDFNKLIMCLFDKFNNLNKLINQLQRIFYIEIFNNAYLYTAINFHDNINIDFLKKKQIIINKIINKIAQWVVINK